MFNPFFTQPQHFEPFQRAMKEQLAQAERLATGIAAAQDAGFERSSAALDEWTALAKANLGYARELGKQWRETSLAAMRQALTVWGA